MLHNYSSDIDIHRESFLSVIAQRELAKGFTLGDMHIELSTWPGCCMSLMVRHRAGWRCAGSVRMVSIGSDGFQIRLVVDPELPENHAAMKSPDGRVTLAVWDGRHVKIPGKAGVANLRREG